MNLEWRLTLFTLVLLPFLATLGFWQLDRADEKAALGARYAQRIAQPPVSLTSLDQTDMDSAAGRLALADRQVSFDAEFSPHAYVLLDNRQREGRVGYEVIALCNTQGMTVPVNLGWVAGDPARRILPNVQLPEGRVSIEGRFYVPTSAAYVLESDDFPEVLPAVVQAFDPVSSAAALMGLVSETDASVARLLPLEVRIAAKSPFAFRADWPIVNQSPAKHTGYAVQWFTMAVVLLIAFIWRSSNIGHLFKRRA
ncbi:MAG: SURF1 family protein [Porticoccaceae bacterium]|nr:SURF1 family protein [Porticoccaceae bacterium]